MSRLLPAWPYPLGLAAAASCLALPQATHAQKLNQPDGLQLTSSIDGSNLVNSILGSGITLVGTPTPVGNVDAEERAQQGLFSTIGSDILGTGFSSGIVLTTGYASNVIGPNESDSTTQRWGKDGLGSAGDPDLNKLTGGKTFDANSLSTLR